MGIVAPAHRRAIVFQREAMIVSAGDGHHIAQTRRHIKLPDKVVAPSHHIGFIQNLVETINHPN